MSSISLIGSSKARPSSSSRRRRVDGSDPSRVLAADQLLVGKLCEFRPKLTCAIGTEGDANAERRHSLEVSFGMRDQLLRRARRRAAGRTHMGAVEIARQQSPGGARRPADQFEVAFGHAGKMI